MIPSSIETADFDWYDLNTWIDALQSEDDDIPLTQVENVNLEQIFVMLKSKYADPYAQTTVPRIRIDIGKLKRLHDRLHAARGILWGEMSTAEHNSLLNIIDSMLNAHPLN